MTRARTMPPDSSRLQMRAVPVTSWCRWAYGMRRPWYRLARVAGRCPTWNVRTMTATEPVNLNEARLAFLLSGCFFLLGRVDTGAGR